MRTLLFVALSLIATSVLAYDTDDLSSLAGTLRQRAEEKQRLTATQRKLDGSLRRVMRGTRAVPGPGPLAPYDLLTDAGTPARVRIRIATREISSAAIDLLVKQGLEVTQIDMDGGLVEGFVSPGDLPKLATLNIVRTIRPALRGRTRAGSVATEGDAASNAPALRGAGYDGSGVTVGVISDGIDSLAASQATGDLGTVAVPGDPRCSRGEGDEGTALLEIVHDLAPGAHLLFSSGLTAAGFSNSVRCLTDAGADVIVDDLGFYDEPFFADGPVAAATRAAVAAGVSFHSAAGNDADQHYEAPYRTSTSTSYHDFLGGPVDNTDDMLVAPYDTVLCVLQWDDAFAHSGNDYDLYLTDAALNVVADSIEVQSGFGDPLEVAGVVNLTSSYQIMKVVIDRYAGASRRLELFCLGGIDAQYLFPQGSIFGHPAVPEVVAVGAVDVLDPGLNDVEPFSSWGPARVAFPSAQTRAKPDLVAFDGVSISNAGGFPLCPPYCDFFGTSAAAPHSAAVAALLLDKDPRLGPSQIQSVLKQSATDIGAAGTDDASGAGRLNAQAAGALVTAPECLSSADCNDQNACTTDACNGGSCLHTALTCSDGDVCNGVETCDPATGCVPGAALTCHDSNACTTDACDHVAGCTHTGIACNDGDVCNGVETCDPATGCIAGTALSCTDDNECTNDTCDPVSGCQATPLGGFPGLDCELGRLLTADLCEGDSELPASAVTILKVGRARGFIAKAAVATKTAKRRKLVGKIDRQLRSLQDKVTKMALKGGLDRDCAAAIGSAVAERRLLVGPLRP